ncbi:MAG: hypothetical protein RIE08_02555 [Acidimicrobiales bacterium]
MTFDAFAVSGRGGPHVTMQAGTDFVGRYWTTTARSSYKARVLDGSPAACVARGVGDSTTVIGGAVTIIDARRGRRALADPVAVAAAGPAVTRLAGTNARQVRGYLRDRRDVPVEWSAVGRVLLAVKPNRDMVIDAAGRVVSAAGAWDRRPAAPATTASPGVSLPAGFTDLGDDHEALVVTPTRGAWLGVLGVDGPVVIPAAWEPDRGVTVSHDALGLVAARLPGPVCVTIDSDAGSGPTDKAGAILRGSGAVAGREDELVLVRIDVVRITCWSGFVTG